MTPEQAQRLGAYLRARREARGLSLRKLGELVGIQNTTIMRLEAGQYAAPSPEKLSRIAEVLGINLADLFAMADYVVPRELPTLTPYLRSKYRQLPGDAANEIQAFAEKLARKHGVDLNGPAPGEDETPTRPPSKPRTPTKKSATKPQKKGATK